MITLHYACSSKKTWSNIKVSKYYDPDCHDSFFPFQIFIVPIVKNSHILGGICLTFLKNALDQTQKVFNTKFGSL